MALTTGIFRGLFCCTFWTILTRPCMHSFLKVRTESSLTLLPGLLWIASKPFKLNGTASLVSQLHSPKILKKFANQRTHSNHTRMCACKHKHKHTQISDPHNSNLYHTTVCHIYTCLSLQTTNLFIIHGSSSPIPQPVLSHLPHPSLLIYTLATRLSISIKNLKWNASKLTYFNVM